MQSWSMTTRWLHIGLAGTVTAQLLLSLVMSPPGEEGGNAFTNALFEIHEGVGLLALAIVLAHWYWTLRGAKDASFTHLFPWSGEARQDVLADIQKLRNKELPETGPRGGLPGLVHGLGFLLVTLSALTGSLIFSMLPEHGPLSAGVENLMGFHGFIGTFVWLYWLGHVALAVWHHLQGQDTVRNMFDVMGAGKRGVGGGDEASKA